MYSPRKNKPATAAYKEPTISLREWKNIFKEIGLDLPSMPELRGTPSAELLSRVYPVVKSPDKGVWLEYDLSYDPDLYYLCKNLIDVYAEVSYQSSQLLARAFTVQRSPQNNHKTSQEKDYENVLASHLTSIRETSAKVKKDMETFNAEIQKGDGTTLSTEQIKVKEYSARFIIEGEAIIDSAVSMIEDIDNDKLNLNNKILLKDIDNVASTAKTIINKTGQLYSIAVADDDLARRIDASAYPNNAESVSNLYDLIENLYAETAEKARRIQRVLTIRFYPNRAEIVHGNPQTAVHMLSHNRFITTKIPESNIMVVLRDIFTLNTLDTQWASFYSQLMSYLVDYGNPEFTMAVGNNKIKRCSFHTVPKFIDNGAVSTAFSVSIITRSTGTDIGEA